MGDTRALVWMQGGGMVLANHLSEQQSNAAFARELGITVSTVKDCLALGSPARAAVNDGYAVVDWLSVHAREEAVDPDRIAVGGVSAGGGLAAAMAHMATDLGDVTRAFQLLVYPMLDDRTILRTDLDTSNARVWRHGSKRYAWMADLGEEPGGSGISAYVAPARRGELSGLSPAWMGIGTLDLFDCGDVTYAERLRESHVLVELVVVEGAIHGFGAICKNKPVSGNFRHARRDALRHALFDTRPR